MFLGSMVGAGFSAALLAEFPLLMLLSFGMITVGLAFAALTFIHGYFLFYEYRHQQTPGKKIFGLKVVSLDGQPLNLEQCFYREFLRYIDILLLVPGVLAVTKSEHGQRFGDRLAATAVVAEIRALENLGYRYMPRDHFEKMSELCPVAEIPEGQFEYFLEFAYRCMKDPHLDLLNSREAIAWELEVRALISNQDRYEIDRNTILAYFAETLHQRKLSPVKETADESQSAA